MNYANRKNRLLKLKDRELASSGVGKIFQHENGLLKEEIGVLKKSLKQTQDELEKLRSRYHDLDKENGILGYRLHTSFLPELIKYLASSIGAGIAVNFFFNHQNHYAWFSLIISTVIYGGVLLMYRK